ncbi:MAG: 2,3-bisphosphoglycerate-independent phosphoglycerate mutase, partial [Agathobacter sp.]|nr:2,3-bisphosphoglycerate-independent phosphoglycerate mutase [Agathobacter sp.]
TALLVVADHGNADQMYDMAKSGERILRTAHSLNPVPFILCTGERQVRIREGRFGLANVAPTILDLFGIEIPESWEESVLE